MTERYSKIVTPDGDTEWKKDPNGSHVGDDRGNYIEMTPLPKETTNEQRGSQEGIREGPS